MKQPSSSSLADYIYCSSCGKKYELMEIHNESLCCRQPLLLHYAGKFQKGSLPGRNNTMWRYEEMLPVKHRENIISLGEGMTPITGLKTIAADYAFSQPILVKDESYNPTGSFKARGMSVAVSKMKELGIKRCIIPTAGNAGGALAAYCAAASIECLVIMPAHTPSVFPKEAALFGARVILEEGLISDCGIKAKELNKDGEYFDVSTLKEPYRIEGKKTMGYEIAEQLNWKLPDAIIYPAGGGTGLIGIWKAFAEMLLLGWISAPLPKMFAVQAENCAPVFAATKDPFNWKAKFHPTTSIASGLVVPYPFGMDLMQKTIRESGGAVITVSDREIIEGIKECASKEGVLLSPEGSAAMKGIPKLLNNNMISHEDQVLFLNTGSAYKYLQELT